MSIGSYAARPRDPPPLTRSYGGFQSAEAQSAKAESGDPVWIPAYAGMSGDSMIVMTGLVPAIHV